ncbi:WXG100 family type VII secretion target [Rhodococcus opacus]|uniref:WXG100 family type VII secretion target n=1 Tax=Rhodococcus opacus TaxID=37919 RepID=UPI0027E1EBF2|nr:WXG100 family type VII secretion target [Rhodococcus opacus]
MGLSARPEDIEIAANHVDTVNGELDTQIRNLRHLVEGSSSVWTGTAQGAFIQLMERYDSSSAKLHQSLADIAGKIRASGQGYDQSEQANLAAIHKAGDSGSLAL